MRTDDHKIGRCWGCGAWVWLTREQCPTCGVRWEQPRPIRTPTRRRSTAHGDDQTPRTR